MVDLASGEILQILAIQDSLRVHPRQRLEVPSLAASRCRVLLNAGLKPAEDYERIYRNSITSILPSQDYLKQKRSSVFHKAFDSG